MTRKILLSFSLLTAGLCLAAPLTPEEALERLGGNGLDLGTRSAASLKPAMIKTTKVGEPSLYVFDSVDNYGYVIVSADDAVQPLLGYSTLNSFDPDNIPPAMEGWLEQYSSQIELLRDQGVNTRAGSSGGITLPAWSAIPPLVKTAWNQNTPYNNKCPLQNGARTYTGCVATAMAQVMNYFQYPEKGQGYVSYDVLNQTLSLDFFKLTFDWSNMLNSYKGDYTSSQADAVATLMMAAGYSVGMNYSTNQSGAISGYIPGALIRNFNYDKGVYYLSRVDRTYTEWATLIYNNLKNVGPVIYDGDTDYQGGHSFICDGYDGNGYFHFNWGWGGSGDGYFLLDSLNPSSIGIGGALGGFNFRQDVILNIRKPVAGTQTEQNEIVLTGSVKGSSSSSFLYFNIYGSPNPGFRYYGADEMTFDIGISVAPANNPSSPVYKTCSNNATFKRYSMPLDAGHIIMCDGSTGYPFPMYTMSGLGLSDGVKYKITAAYRPDGGDWMEMPAGVGSYNYFYITKNGSNYTFENFDQMQFTCNSLQALSELYDGTAVKMSMSLSNNHNTELTRGVTLALLDDKGRLAFMGDSFVESLSPNQTLNKEWVTNLKNQSGSSIKQATTYYLALYDIDTNTYYYKSTTPVTMMPALGAPSYTCTLTIDNGKLLDYPNYNVNIYEVQNAQNIEVSVEIDVTQGIFSYPINIYGGYDAGNGQIRFPSMTYPLDLRIIDAGQSDTYKATVDYSSAEVGEIYFLIADVNNDYQIIQGKDDIVGFIALSNDAGIDSITSSDSNIQMLYNRATGKLVVTGAQAVEVYSLNGMKLSTSVSYAGDNAEADLSSLGKGIVIVTAVDKEGHRKSVKLAL